MAKQGVAQLNTKQEFMFGKVIGVSKDGNLVIEIDDELLKVSSKHCSIEAEHYIGQMYAFEHDDILSSKNG